MSPSTKGIMKASLEAIAYQGVSGLFRDLTLCMQRAIDEKIDNQVSFMKLNLGAIVFKHTGLAIQFKLDPEPGLANASAMPIILDPNSPFLQVFKDLNLSRYADAFTSTHEKIIPVCKDLRGSIDLGKSKVSGVFSSIPTEIYLGSGLWSVSKLNAEEIAAILLHEIGHVFTYFEALTHTTTANITLMCAKRDINKMENQEERIKLVFEVAQFLDANIEDAKKLADPNLSDSEFHSIFLAGIGSAKTITYTDTKVYNLRSSEVVADQFANRHGAGRALVTGLAKLDREFSDIYTRPIWLSFIFDVMKIISYIGVLVSATIASPAGIALWLAIGCMVIGYLGMANPELRIYDDPAERIERVRKDTIQTLKSNIFNQKVRNKLLADLEEMKEIAKPFKDYRSLANMLWIYIGSSRRRQYKQMRFEQELEKLVNNEIFVKAAQLQSLV